MSFKLETGDLIWLESVEFRVEHLRPMNLYLLSDPKDQETYIFRTYEELETLFNAGKLKFLGKGPGPRCSHVWKRYTGFKDVFDYCDKCGNKMEVSWRNLS